MTHETRIILGSTIGTILATGIDQRLATLERAVIPAAEPAE